MEVSPQSVAVVSWGLGTAGGVGGKGYSGKGELYVCVGRGGGRC